MDAARRLVERVRRNGVRDERVLAAIGRVPRDRFVPEELRGEAWDDEALPIGLGQTISQPTMVALLCEALGLRGPERVLDVGTGSGYQAAVLAELAAEVVSIERLEPLAERACATLAGAGYGRVELLVGDGSLGVPERAPFDAIAVAAAAPEPPPALVRQLGPGGRLVVPVGPPETQVLQVVTAGPGGLRVERGVACRFVPLVATRPSRRRVRVTVRGRVQGVSFRASLRERAASLGAGGWVRNLADGSVEAELEGSPETVDALLAWCGRGPAGARVDAVDVAERAPAGDRDFAVRHDTRW